MDEVDNHVPDVSDGVGGGAGLEVDDGLVGGGVVGEGVLTKTFSGIGSNSSSNFSSSNNSSSNRHHRSVVEAVF